jgi:hypothetical protein
MSDTPRCDSEEVGFDDETVFHLGRTVWYVPADFSKQLERELNETERLLKIADEDCDALRDYVWFLETAAGELRTQMAKEAFNNRTKQ